MDKKLFHSSVLVAGALVLILSVGYFQPATATHSAVSILAMPSESAGVTSTLAKVYAEPEDASQILDVLPPQKQVQILGLNESGAWIAIAQGNQSALAGWISASELKHDLVVGTTRTLVRTYQQPNSSSGIQSVLTPGIKVQVLGRSPDNAWVALSNAGSPGAMVQWVASSDIKLPDVIATTSNLTKLYARPDSGSAISYVLPPAQKVVLMGRNSNGTWFAAADINSKKFIGWAQVSDLVGGIDRTVLPDLTVR